MQKKGAALPIKVIVVIVLILIVLVVSILFATGTFREVFDGISTYLGFAKEGLAENLPDVP